MDGPTESKAPLAKIEDFVSPPGEKKFLAACIWFRRNHVFAFILGLFTLGIPYAMAGIGGARAEFGYPPLVSFWSNKKVKWIASITLIGELIFLGSVFVKRVIVFHLVALELPFLLILAMGIVEVLYQVLTGSDGFAVTQMRTFDHGNRAPVLRGPAKAANALFVRAPQSFQPTLGLLWAWLLGLVFAATFITAVFYLIVVGIFLLFAAIAIAVILFFLNGDRGEPIPNEPQTRPDPVDDYPPVPFDGFKAVDSRGRTMVVRDKGRFYNGDDIVGFAEGSLISFYTERAKKPVLTFQIDGDEILDIVSRKRYGRFTDEAILDMKGNILYRLVETNL